MVAHTNHCKKCHPKHLHLATKDGFELMDIANILFLKGDGNYTYLYTVEGEKILICHNLGWFEQRLPPCFARPNQSYIVNLHFLLGVKEGGYLHFSKKIPFKIEIKKAYADEFHARLDRWNIDRKPTKPKTDLESDPTDLQ